MNAPGAERTEGAGSPPADDSAEAARTFSRRVLAYLADVALLAVVLGALHRVIFANAFAESRPEWTKDGVWLELFVVATMSIPCWLYFSVLEAGPRQATLGKRLAGLRVTGLAGERLSLRRAFVRTVFKLLPWELTHVALLVPKPLWDDPDGTLMRPLFMLSTFLVGTWLVAAMLTPRQQGVHDLVASSLVVPAARPRGGS